MAGAFVVGGLDAVGGVAHRFELVAYCRRGTSFEVEAIGQVLVVEARGVGGLLDVEAIVDDGDDVVGYGGDDRGAAGRAEDEVRVCRRAGTSGPWVVTMVGVMAESGRLPGAMALAEPWMRP